MGGVDVRSGFRPARDLAVRLLLTAAACAALAGALLFGLTLGGRAQAGDEPRSPPATTAPAEPDEPCLRCHGDAALSMTFPSGEALSLYVDAGVVDASVHGGRLECLDCHQRNREYPHPTEEVRSRRDYARAEYETCKRCHFENYTRSQDSIHFDAMAEGEAKAAICTDCHSAHAVKSLKGARTEIVSTCANCHDEIYESYAKSVHGAALEEKDNPDVPGCIDCHGVHDIAAATTASFRRGSVFLCANCHSNKKLMDKYDISSNVFKTYLDDFHGKTAGFYQKQSPKVWPDVAVCSDCHGVHDIKPPDDPDSKVVKQNLVETCRKCHEDATTNFPSAWLSHYEPSINKASLVYLVKQYYRILIPMMVVGLGLNVALDLWRLARNR
jgi:predicted CXXCH cytochrome family protein